MFLPRQLAVKRPSSRQPSDSYEQGDAKPVKRQRVESDKQGTSHNIFGSSAYINSHDATEIVKCLELLLSNYFTQNVSPRWLIKKTRTVDEHNDYVHLSALLEHEIFSTIKPLPTQKKLVTALQCCPSQRLQVSSDGYHIRNHTPIRTIESKDWDSSTIYIEPDVCGISASPGRVARILTECNPELSIEWVLSGGSFWAFVILSKALDLRAAEEADYWPPDWIVMTKKEHQERDSCYLKLREMSRQQVLTYPFGVIVFLRNLHPEATKSSIHSFLTRCVEKYKSRKPNKNKEGILVNSPQDFTIDYIDYKPKCGFDTAHARVKTSENAQLLVHALKKRKRVMGRGDDYKGRKSKADGNFVTGEVIIGDREKIYWEGVLTKAKSRKLS